MNRMMILAMAVVVAFSGMAADADAGLFDRLKCRRAAKKCCKQDTCCEPAPTCCPAPEPTCCPAPEPTCCEPAPACGCEAAAPACGCEAAAAPSCGCEVQTCGCETSCETDCNCLNRRQLRRAKRKGECCDAEPNTCYTCSAPASDCGCSAPVSDCGCGTTMMMESAPAPAEAAPAEEAAPEAPEASAT